MAPFDRVPVRLEPDRDEAPRVLEARAVVEVVRLLVLRDRVLVPPLLAPDLPVLALLRADVLVLRDPGGEDVRVAMLQP